MLSRHLCTLHQVGVKSMASRVLRYFKQEFMVHHVKIRICQVAVQSMKSRSLRYLKQAYRVFEVQVQGISKDYIQVFDISTIYLSFYKLVSNITH